MSVGKIITKETARKIKVAALSFVSSLVRKPTFTTSTYRRFTIY
jgi:pantoate kinase